MSIENRLLTTRFDWANWTPPTLEELSARWGGWRLEGLMLSYPAYSGGVYPVDVERFTTSAQVLDVIMQVANKRWVPGGPRPRPRRHPGAAGQLVQLRPRQEANARQDQAAREGGMIDGTPARYDHRQAISHREGLHGPRPRRLRRARRADLAGAAGGEVGAAGDRTRHHRRVRRHDEVGARLPGLLGDHAPRRRGEGGREDAPDPQGAR
jgi:hypothetical protein